MKHTSIILLTCLLVACNKKAYLFTSFNEPADAGLRMLYSYDGYKWSDFDTVFLKPQVGNQKVMRDPSMVEDKHGTFHLVWTSSWRGDKGFGYASSKDLIHWSEQQFLPVMQHEPTTVNVWAPELYYDKARDTFMIVWASCIPGRYDRGQEDDSNNHRLYFTRTHDFKTYSPASLFLEPGYSVIDAIVLKRKKEDYVCVFKDNTRPMRNIKVAFGKSYTGPWENLSLPVTDLFTEGPSVVHVKDKWLIYFDAYRKKTYDALSTTDFKRFKDVSSKVHIPVGHKHGTIVPVKRSMIKSIKAMLNG